MAKKNTLIKWAFVLLAICVFLLIVFVLSLTPANKSQPPVDYIAKYNQLNKPADFDPNDNASPYFDKAFALMVESPNDIKALYKLWPVDMNDEQLQIAKQWVESNKQTLDYLKQAFQKTYYWKPLPLNGKPLLMADLKDLAKFRKATHLLCLDAKLMAHEGQIEPALRQLTDVYKMGMFLAGPKFLVEQLVGISIGTLTVQSGFEILDRTNPPPAILEDFQRQITSLASRQPFLMDFAGERLMVFDGFELILSGYGQRKPGLYLRKLFLGTVGRAWMTRERNAGRI